MTNIKDTILNFQYQYSRLFNLGFNRKKYSCISTSDKLWAENTSKNTYLALFSTLFSCGLLFTGLIEAFVNKVEINLEFILMFFVVHIFVGLLGLRQFLWLINGRQELTVENNVLTLTKKGTFLTKPKVYSLDLVKNLRVGIDKDKMTIFEKIKSNIGVNRKVIFGHILGQILFDYKGQTIKIFNDLNKNERQELLTEITQIINTPKNVFRKL